MSRVFDASQTGVNDNYLFSQPSAAYNNLSAVTVAAWIKTPSYATGVIFVKDPLNSYNYDFYLDSDGTLFFGGGAGAPNTFGRVQEVQIVNAGSGYAFSDTVGIDGGVGGTQVCAIFGTGAGGSATAVGATNPFSGNYTLNSTHATTAITGVGTGLTLKATKMTPENFFTGSTSIETVPLNTWTHVAATLDWSEGTPKARLYINGVECTYSLQETGGVQTPDDSADGWYLGNDTFDDGFNGSIAESVIYGTKMTQPQIAALAASTSGATGTPVSYWHLCGNASPEPDASGNHNSMALSANPPIKGVNSPGFSNCGSASTSASIFPGSYPGASLAVAFFNPHRIDLMQVVNEGGEVVWSLTYSGVATVNPGSFTPTALLGRFYGASFALAFPNPYSKNVLQIIAPGDKPVFWVDSTGETGSA